MGRLWGSPILITRCESRISLTNETRDLPNFVTVNKGSLIESYLYLGFPLFHPPFFPIPHKNLSLQPSQTNDTNIHLLQWHNTHNLNLRIQFRTRITPQIHNTRNRNARKCHRKIHTGSFSGRWSANEEFSQFRNDVYGTGNRTDHDGE